MTEAQQQSTPGGDGPTSTVTDPRRWRADDEHVEWARRVEGDIGEKAAREWIEGAPTVWSRADRVYPPYRSGEELGDPIELILEDPSAAYGDRFDDMTDEETGEPFVLVDRQGRRYSVEIEATVTPLPDPATEIARYDAEMAAHKAMLARGAASITDPNRGRGRLTTGGQA